MHRSLSATHATIALEDIGSGPALVFLHGYPATRKLWTQVVSAMASDGYRILVPDLVGYGDSVPEPNASIDMISQSRWLLEMLNVLEVEKVVLVAHDIGSAAAQLMLHAAPQRVRALVILDGAHAGEWAMDSIESIRSWNPSDAHRLFPVLARRLAATQGMRELLDAYSGSKGGQQLIRAAKDLEPKQLLNIQADLATLDLPALVLWGREDKYLSVDTVGKPLAALLKAPLVTLSGGHFTPLDCPIDVVSALRGFLEALDH